MIEKTYDPIIGVRDYQNKYFAQIPIPEIGTQIIMYATTTGESLLITKGTEVKPRELYKGKYDKAITVDMGMHIIGFSGKYPSRGRGGDFIIRVEAAVKVIDADAVWKRGIHDVASELEAEMNAELREAAASCPIDAVDTLQQVFIGRKKTLYLSEAGLEIQRTDYDVKLEEKYEELIKNRTYEKLRVDSAKSIKNLYRDSETALFAEVASGAKTPEQAIQDLKREYTSDFDERVRQMKAAAEFLAEVRGNNLADEEMVRAQMNMLLQGLQMNANQMLESGKDNSNEEKGKNSDSAEQTVEYASFDD